MTSPNLEGEVEFNFNSAGMLQSLMFSCQITERQYNYIFAIKPYNLTNMKLLIENTPNATFVKVVVEITFEDFWNKYGEKEHSSKKKAQTRWNNMPKSSQIKAYNYIPKYKYNLPAGVRMKYAETYLNSEIWEK
jgi:hypothetical protein